MRLRDGTEARREAMIPLRDETSGDTSRREDITAHGNLEPSGARGEDVRFHDPSLDQGPGSVGPGDVDRRREPDAEPNPGAPQGHPRPPSTGAHLQAAVSRGGQ